MKKQKKMDIIYEDKELLIINKPAGLLTIATEKEKINTLYHQAREYIKKQNPQYKIFIVHRLDKDTSGIVIFAKNEKVKKEMQNNWNNIVFLREYLAIVEGNVQKKSDTIKSYLKENSQFKVYSTNSRKGALAITYYETLKRTKAYSLLKIRIKTGRKNQIRAQLKEINHPIIGDKKYGSHKNPLRRMGLHASCLGIKINKKIIILNSKIPKEFKNMWESEIFNYEQERKRYGTITENNSK